MKRLDLLDYGRFFAAIGVVAYHLLFFGFVSGRITTVSFFSEIIDVVKYGYLGVELFFMISGYVIFFSAKKASVDSFAVSRAVRLYPAFLFAVLFTTTFKLMWGGESMTVTLDQVLVNFTMIPSAFGYPNVDGVYWSLTYELVFYFMVFLLLFFGFRDKLEVLVLAWPPVIFVAQFIGLDGLPYLSGYFSYFSSGAIFAVMMNRVTYKSIVALILSLFLCIQYSASQAGRLSESSGFPYSELVISIVVFCFFVFFFVLNSKSGRSLKLYGSSLLGRLTYPIYLIHAHFGYIVVSRFATEENKVVVYALTVMAIFVVAYLINVFVEQKPSKLWRFLFDSTIGLGVSVIQRRFLMLNPMVRKYPKEK